MTEEQTQVTTPKIPELKRPKLGFSTEVRRLELEEGTWVEYKLPQYDQYVKFASDVGSRKDDPSGSAMVNLDLVKLCVVAWSDENVPCTPESISNLGTDVILYIASEIMRSIAPEKKS